MRWAALLVALAAVCAVINLVRGVIVYDGVALLAVALLAAALVAALLSHVADQKATRSADRRYPL
jgi:hypothetical protein